MNVDTIISNLNLQYYNNITQYMKKHEISNSAIISYFNKLNEKTTDSDSITKSDTCSAYDVNLYKKPWTKLNIIHKIIKIKEYVDNMEKLSNNKKTEMKDELINLVKTKILTKKDKVNYDEINGFVISINN
jgi:hypothetical protein